MSSSSDTLAVPLLRPQRKVAGPSVAVARFDEQFPATGADRRGTVTPEQAWTAGYEVGMEQGMAMGRAATEADTAAADRRAAIVANAFALAADRVNGDLEMQFALATDSVLATAFEVAFAIIERDLREHPRTGEEALRVALAVVPTHEPCVARLHPSDAALLDGSDAVAALVAGRPEFTIVSDPSVASGDCMIDMESARVELRLDEALARVRTALRADDLAASIAESGSLR
jgi:flagellar assembly protein FliH